MTIIVPGWFLAVITAYLAVDAIGSAVASRAQKRAADAAFVKISRSAFDIERYLAERKKEDS